LLLILKAKILTLVKQCKKYFHFGKIFFMEIFNRIKEIRKSLNLTQSKFADLLNVSNGFISEIESGNKKPGYDILISLKKEFNININWLLIGEGEMLADIVPAPPGVVNQEAQSQGEQSDKELKLEMENCRLKAQVDILKEVLLMRKVTELEMEMSNPLDSSPPGQDESLRGQFWHRRN
jgi:transcriptional regulator with XRE-family HTH domain